MKEENYIRYRKLKAFGSSLSFYLCRIFPIQKNLISVCTFEGKGGFGCNPKYVVEELHKRNSKYRFVWFVNDMNKTFPDYIKKVPNTLWSRAYWLSVSKVWIDNYRKPYGTKKRRNQYYLNVNHYTIGIKCTGLNRGSGFSEMAYLVSKNDSAMIDHVVTDSDWAKESTPKGLVYDGEFLNTGAPRCDVLYGDKKEKRKWFRDKNHLPEDARIILYAPTFREGAKDGKRSVYSQIWSIDFARLKKNFEEKFGGTWYICIRVHPQLASVFEEYRDDRIQEYLINESQADDMYEILAGMDAYITDYSSAIFEAGFAHIPSFIYADDIETYKKDRGNLMWNIASDSLDYITNNKDITPQMDVVFPFSVATNNEEMEKRIIKFNMEKYEKDLDDFHKKIGLVFSGDASSKIADVIGEKCN